MKKRKNKHHIPHPRHNPVAISRELDKLKEESASFKHILYSVNKANDQHVEHLSNFVRHDLKNTLQGLDGTIYNAEQKDVIPKEFILQLRNAVDLIRATLDNFTKLIPDTNNSPTSMHSILTSVQLLSRGDFFLNRIIEKFVYDKNDDTRIHQPMQAIVQVVHNIVINAINALKGQSEKRILIEGKIIDELCYLEVSDNGPIIEEATLTKIYDYGFSTTGGTGVGLCHAKYVMSEINGEIFVNSPNYPEYNKTFVLKFPIGYEKNDINN